MVKKSMVSKKDKTNNKKDQENKPVRKGDSFRRVAVLKRKDFAAAIIAATTRKERRLAIEEAVRIQSRMIVVSLTCKFQ